jgi:hypothetical protein
MESVPMEPGHAAAELARAEQMRAVLTRSLHLPSGFHESIGAAVAVQIAATSYALTRSTMGVAVLAPLVGGVVVFVVVAAVQLERFRRLNGVWVGGLASRAVLGSSHLSSTAYGASLAASGWAASSGLGWLAVTAAAVGGTCYALIGRRWWAAYLREPAQHAQGPSLLYAAGSFVVAFAAFVVVARGRW